MVQQLWQCLPKSFNGNLLAQSKRFSFGTLFSALRDFWASQEIIATWQQQEQ